MNFYISDNHFGHFNIIRYDGRPFNSVDEMDKAMIERWNNAVSNNDTVYILGDFSWHKNSDTISILNRLSGQKVLIRGNHDNFPKQVTEKFVKVCDYLEINDGHERLVLSHYPLLFWNKQFNDSVHLYGHVHSTRQWDFCKIYQKELQEAQNIPMRMFNVGCMMEWMNYTPRTLQEILDSNLKLRGSP